MSLELFYKDKNFFKHPGVDAKGVIRAIKNNIFNLILILKFYD